MRPAGHWSCRGSYKLENGLEFAPNEMLGLNLAWAWAPLLPPDDASAVAAAPVPAAPVTRTSVPHASAWHVIAESYSARRFTFPRHRLAVPAGITRHVAEQMAQPGGRPLLGLWERSFCRDLEWIRTTAHPDPAFAVLATELSSSPWLSSLGTVPYDYWYWETGSRLDWVREVEVGMRLLGCQVPFLL
ncbi:hypothetical protein VTI74DRAFT_6953 [Chaetomium olivicolor]